MKKSVIILGKGGVGKSSLAVALALRASEAGLHDRFLVSFDPAHNIGDILGVSSTGKPEKVEEGFTIWEIDLERAIKDYLEETGREIRRAFRNLAAFNLEGYIDILSLSPGTLEQASYLVLKDLLTGEGNLLIMDMPPTGLALRILALPWTNSFWLDKLIDLRKAIVEKRKQLSKIEGRGQAEDPLLGELIKLKEESEKTAQMIGESLLIFIVEPENLSINEARRAMKSLELLGLKPDFYVVNKLGRPPYPPRSPDYFAGIEKVEIPWIDGDLTRKMGEYLTPILEALA